MEINYIDPESFGLGGEDSIYNNVYINSPKEAEQLITTLEKAKEKAKTLKPIHVEYKEPKGKELEILCEKMIKPIHNETIKEHFDRLLPYREQDLVCPSLLDSRIQGLCSSTYCDCDKCWGRDYVESICGEE